MLGKPRAALPSAAGSHVSLQVEVLACYSITCGALYPNQECLLDLVE